MKIQIALSLLAAATLLCIVYGCRCVGKNSGGPAGRAVENFRSTVFKSSEMVVKPLGGSESASGTKYSMAAEKEILRNMQRARIAAKKSKGRGDSDSDSDLF